jgi:hypothetical protein
MAMQLTQVSFGGALDQSIRAELADPEAAVLNAENTRQTKNGARVKRYGFTPLTRSRLDATSRTVGARLFSHGRQMCVFDQHFLESYDANTNTWAIHGRLPDIGVERFPAATIGGTAAGLSSDLASLAYANGMYFVACNEQVAASTYNIVVHCINRATRATIKVLRFTHGFPTGGAVNVRLATVGNTLICVYRTNTNELSARTISVASAAGLTADFSAATVISSTYNGSDFDCFGGATLLYVAYDNNSGAGTSLTVASYNTSLVLQTSKVDTVTAAQVTHVAIDGSESDNIWVAFSYGTTANVEVQGHSPSALGTLTATAANVLAAGSNGFTRLGIRRTSSTAGHVVGSGATTVANWRVGYARAFNVSAGATTALESQSVVYGWQPESAPFVLGGRTLSLYRFIAEATNTGATHFSAVVDLTNPTRTQRPVGAPASGLFVTVVPTTAAMNVVSVSSTVAATMAAVKYNSVDSALEIFEFEFGATHLGQVAEHNGTTYLSGGLLYGFDGAQPFEASYVAPPSIRTAIAAGGSVDNGAHIYVATYEWTDADGNVHWSEPSRSITATTSAGNNTVTLTYLSNEVTWKDGLDGGTSSPSGYAPRDGRKVKIKIWRTAAGTSAPFYLVTTVNSYPGAGIGTTNDTASDLTISANAQLYISPGERGTSQVRRCPPGLVALTSYNGLLVGIGEDRRTLWHSAQPVVGEGAWFNPVWQYPMELGELVGLRAMDGTLFVFARRGILAVTGEPPSDNAAAGGLGTPRRLATDDGCIDERSLVVTSQGIFFMSDDGLKLLTRGGSVVFAGAPVMDSTDTYPSSMAATVDATESVVYFDVAAGSSAGLATGNGRALVFDLQRAQWESVDRRTNAVGTEDQPAQSAAVVYYNSAWRYAWLDAEGRVYVENKASYLDDSAWVTMRVESAWFKPSGLQGRMQPHRLMFLGRRSTDHNLYVALAYDYSTTYKSATTFARATIATVTSALNGGQEQLQHCVHDDAGECEAIRVVVYDSAPTGGTVGTGQGASFVGLTLEWQPKPDGYRLPTEAG